MQQQGEAAYDAAMYYARQQEYKEYLAQQEPAEYADQAEYAAHMEQAEYADQAEYAAQMEQAEYAAQMEQAEYAEQMEQAEYAEQVAYEQQEQAAYEQTQEPVFEQGHSRRSKNFHLTRILLKFVASMAQAGEVSLEQKGFLKDLIVDQDQTILAVAETFDAQNDLHDFKDSLLRLAMRN